MQQLFKFFPKTNIYKLLLLIFLILLKFPLILCKILKLLILIERMQAKFIGKAKLTKQGQLTLPQEARQDLKIDPKSEVYWYEFNDILILVKELVNPKEIVSLIFNRKKRK